MTKNKYLFLILVGLIMVPTFMVSAKQESNGFKVNFVSADHGDFDNDGQEDDCEAFLEFVLEFKPKNLVNHEFDLVLTLPSGKTITVSGGLLVKISSSSYVIRFVITNSAYEEGWYSFSFMSVLRGHGPPRISFAETTFDPPKGEQGGFPSVFVELA